VFEGFFDGSEGQVFYRRWEPDAPHARIIQIVHGYAEHGGRYAHVERSLQAVRDMPTEDLTVHVYEGARHEVLNESNRDEVIRDLADWVDRIAPA